MWYKSVAILQSLAGGVRVGEYFYGREGGLQITSYPSAEAFAPGWHTLCTGLINYRDYNIVSTSKKIV